MTTVVLLTLPFQTALAAGATPLAPVVEADGRLGLCDVLPGPVPGQAQSAEALSWAQLAYNGGARFNRWEFRWDRIEPKNGQWDFSSTDGDVADSTAAGLQVEGIIDGIPGWATAAGQPPGNGVPKGLRRPLTDPRNVWATFVRALALHYAGQVRFWQIWNEPDLKYYWNGSAGDYAALLEVAYSAIKSVAPDDKILLAGVVEPNLALLSQVLDAIGRPAPNQQGPFDIAAWHAYGQVSRLYGKLQRLRGLLSAKGFGSAPIWVTEDGFPASNPAGGARQASYVLQTIAYALVGGASRVLVYRASDDTGPDSWGLTTATGAIRPSYVAFQVAARYLAHTQSIVYAPTSHIERFVFYQRDRRVVLLWNRAPSDVVFHLPAGHTQATLVNSAGASAALSAQAGKFSSVVPAANYPGVAPSDSTVGGPPVLLAEDNADPGLLADQSYVPPVPGRGRTLLLLNPAGVAATVQVSAQQNPRQRQVVQIAPSGVGGVDLDLLAGAGYGGAYVVSSSTPVAAEATSTSATAASASPSADWYLAAADGLVTLTNPGASTATVQIAAYGSRGRIRASQTVTVPALSTGSWTLPAGTTGTSSLVAHASSPIVLSGTGGRGAAQPQASWYAVRPGNSRLAVFNPGSATADVNLQFVGGTTLRSEQLRLGPRRTYIINPDGAKAVVAASTSGVTLGYAGSSPASAPQTQTTVSTGLAIAGATTRVYLFDPSAQPAHVSLSVVTGKGTTLTNKNLNPSQVYSFRVRAASGPQSGVLVTSDTPIVAAPGS